MKKALFTGSFNPPTLGHLDIIHRASKLCEKLYVGVAENTAKAHGLLSIQERMEMLQTLTQDSSTIEVVSVSTLVVHYATEKGIQVLIRSLRNGSDLNREYAMAVANKQMSGIETVFLLADPQYEHISSRLVREIASLGGSLKGFVPTTIEEFLRKTFDKIA